MVRKPVLRHQVTQNSQNEENSINKYGKKYYQQREIERSAEEAHIVVTGKLFQKDTYIEIVNETVNKIVVDDEIFEINF